MEEIGSDCIKWKFKRERERERERERNEEEKRDEINNASGLNKDFPWHATLLNPYGFWSSLL